VDWVAVVPVKALPEAKSRLDRDDRADLALAMATDTVAAAAACDAVIAVVVVTDDRRARDALEPLATVVPDEPDRGLNDALAHGGRVAAARWPDAGVAVLTADLPALRPDHLAVALAAAGQVPRALVADAAGHGTVLLTARPGVELAPAFGDRSRDAHRAAGVSDLTDGLAGDVPGLRRDVDTLDDLAAAHQIGLGRATRAALGGFSAPALQVTVRSFVPGIGGLAVTDDGRWETLPGDARLVGFRVLHSGQRVRLARSADTAEAGVPGTLQISPLTPQDRRRLA
jgi:2-phospho-L-lactate guanylyltransferase